MIVNFLVSVGFADGLGVTEGVGVAEVVGDGAGLGNTGTSCDIFIRMFGEDENWILILRNSVQRFIHTLEYTFFSLPPHCVIS